MNIFNNGTIIGLSLAFIDIISMSIIKQINLGLLQKNWLPIAVMIYGCQMIIFNYGLNITSMTVLNLSWNLFSNILITLIGIYYFKENINHLETYGLLFAILALFLFALSEFNK
jgi:TRAP-type mannitol/chloroaromatic compound transport system permease small subunit